MPNNSNNTSELYQVIHSSPEIKTVGDYITQHDSPANQYATDSTGAGFDEFLKVVGPDGKTNRERIEENFFTPEDKKTKGKPAKTLALKTGTVLYIPVEKINRIGLLTEGINVVSNNSQAFLAKALTDLMSDVGYESVQKPLKGKLQKGSLKKQFPDISVWIWCRALSTPDKPDGELKGQIFNITPFIEDLNTTVAKGGGNFQIKLPPLTCELKNNIWAVKKNALVSYASKDVNKKEYFAKDFLNQRITDSGTSREEYRRNDFLFHTIISPNDLVFIRFETLISEANQRSQEEELDFIVSESRLPNCIFDMIGLVDRNGITMQSSSTDVTVNITGRDLSKLFIEDGTYFYPLEFSQGELNFAGGSTNKNALMQRVFSDNALNYLGLYYNQSIEHVIKFVMQQLSTIKVVPDDLFFYYPERNTRFDPDNDSKDKLKNLDVQNESAKQHAREAIATIRTRNKIQEDTDKAERAKVEEVLQQMIKFRKTILDQKKNTQTGWKAFVYVNERGVREDIGINKYPVYFKKQLYNTTIFTPDDVSTYVMQSIQIDKSRSDFTHQQKYQQQLAPGIWQIIYLVIDNVVTDRRIVDSSMSSANGALLNFFQKVCQEPFVEFSMDTFNNAFYLMVRKPPFDASGMRSAVQGQYLTEKGQIVGENPPIVIDIEDSDVISESLDYDSSNAVSWYHFTPQASFLGDSNNYSLAYIPAVFFPEYAAIWGSKPMQLVNNYTPFLFLDKKDNNALNTSEKQAFEDLKYMIESTAYLPFARKGTVTINGDRRIKRGIFVRYKSTGEIFYVDLAQQKYKVSDSDIDRSTVLQLSHGLVEKYIFGQTVEGIDGRVSYFDIINTKLNNQAKVNTKKITTTKDQTLKDDSKTKNRDYNEEVKAYARQYSFTVLGSIGDGTPGYLGKKVIISKVDQIDTDINAFIAFLQSKNYKITQNGDTIIVEITNSKVNTPDPTTTQVIDKETIVTEIDRDSILSNFKVNVPVFNFFLKRLQQGNKDLYYISSSDTVISNRDNEDKNSLNSRDIINKA